MGKGRAWVWGLALLVALISGPASAAAVAARQCQTESVPVAALASSPHMAGTLCQPERGTSSTVVVLVPGATYDHVYWDFPYRSQRYDFRAALNRAGYATYVVDRLGTGASSRVPSVSAAGLVQVMAVHATVQALRAGRLGGQRFTRVVLGGHSLGSGIALIEAATFHDVEALLLTGYSHWIDPLTVVGGLPGFYPAGSDPMFAGQGYDPGYLTTRPGTRGPDFYAPGDSDPNVIATDEATKSVVSAPEFIDTLALAETPYSDLVKVPVLIADGSLDKLSCNPLVHNCASPGALRSSEAPEFTGTPCLETYLLPGSGHDINLALNASAYQARVVAWLGEGGCESAARSRLL